MQLLSLSPAKGGGFCVAKLGGIASADLSFPCVKGGGTAEAVTEGLSLLSFSMICKSADLLYNPSVNFVDSSLCTREPNRNSLLCVKGGGTPLGVTEELVLLSFIQSLSRYATAPYEAAQRILTRESFYLVRCKSDIFSLTCN